MREYRRSPPFRVLLDENVDRLLKLHFRSEVEIVTVAEQGWQELATRNCCTEQKTGSTCS